MKNLRWLKIAGTFLAAACVLVSACHHSPIPTGNQDTLPPGPGSLTVSPLRFQDYLWATPLGSLNPPGHTFPTDHVYFYWVDPAHATMAQLDSVRVVYAPGSGVVNFLMRPSPGIPDMKIMVQMTGMFTYYLDHVLLDSGIVLGSQVQAGQRMGTTSPYSYALDLGVLNDEITLTGIVNPKRYPDETIHTDSPYKYFVEPLRDSLYATVQRNSVDKDGKIDFDIPGKLVGDWFLKGLPVSQSADPSAWPKGLAFVYDMTNPTAIRICIGGILSMWGLYAVDSTALDPASVSVTSGPVAYRLYNPYDSSFPSLGLMMVQMMSDDTIKVETFPKLNASSAPFDSAASIYAR